MIMGNGRGRRTTIGSGRRVNNGFGKRLSPRKPAGRRLY